MVTITMMIKDKENTVVIYDITKKAKLTLCSFLNKDTIFNFYCPHY